LGQFELEHPVATSVSVAYIIAKSQIQDGRAPMSRKSRRVAVDLNAKGLKEISQAELKAVLRGADEIIGRGGRTLLTRILRGSANNKVLEHGLDQSPVYGYFHNLSDDDTLARIDWVILHGYLRVEYSDRLPLLEFTSKGWEIEREAYAIELLAGFDEILRDGPPYPIEFLKDRDREMILLLLDKTAATEDAKYVPLLEAWRMIDYQKVRRRIGQVIHQLKQRSG
jgi:superfamily II DNA helicase RecQ